MGRPGKMTMANGYKDDVYGWNFVDNSATIVPHSHGTHVAGTVAAVNNNGKGVCGVAGGSGPWGWGTFVSCQIFKPNPSNPEKDLGSSLLPAAIKYGADNGAVISQNSWGFQYPDRNHTSMDGATRAAIDYFINYAGIDENGNQVGPMKGGIVIFAAEMKMTIIWLIRFLPESTFCSFYRSGLCKSLVFKLCRLGRCYSSWRDTGIRI